MSQILANHLAKNFALPVNLICKKSPVNEKTDFQFEKLIDYKGCLLDEDFASVMPEVEKLQGKKDDIFVACFSKSGTTWVQAIVTMILNDADSTVITNEPLNFGKRWCFLEFKFGSMPTPISMVDQLIAPRTFKTHLLWDLLPAEVRQDGFGKVIYVYRNPKDVMVSYYYFCKYMPNMARTCPTDSFKHFAEAFMRDEVVHAPYFRNIASFWEHRHNGNILFVSYEQLHKEPSRIIKEISHWLGKSLSDEKVENIRHYCSFTAMEKNDNVNMSKFCTARNSSGDIAWKFFRSGKIGDWKHMFTSDLNDRVDAWIKSNLENPALKDFVFDWE